MKKTVIPILLVALLAGCGQVKKTLTRVPVAEVGKSVLYIDQIPDIVPDGTSESDSLVIVKNYVTKWTKRQLLLQKADQNLSPELKEEVNRQMEDMRANLLIYQYQRQLMFEKMDTVLSDADLESYYSMNEKSFVLPSNIVKALFIKLPSETPNLERIRSLARSNGQADLQELESYCYQFAEKFDDFNENWVTMDRISIELHEDIENQESFLKRYTYYETKDSSSVYLLTIRDYRLRSSLAPFEYVKNDIKRIIWNTRRLELIQSLENGIYNDALKDNSFKIY